MMFLSRSNASAANVPSCELNLSFYCSLLNPVRGARCDKCRRRAPPFPRRNIFKRGHDPKTRSRFSHHGRIRSMIAATHRSRYAPFQGTGISARAVREGLEIMSSCCLSDAYLDSAKCTRPSSSCMFSIPGLIWCRSIRCATSEMAELNGALLPASLR
jgi:hypothetical protein